MLDFVWRRGGLGPAVDPSLASRRAPFTPSPPLSNLSLSLRRARRFSAWSRDSPFSAGLTGLSVSSAKSSILSPNPSAYRSMTASASLLSGSSSSSELLSAENGNRPRANSTSVIPRDHTSDLTEYGSPEIRSGCSNNGKLLSLTVVAD